MIRSSPQRRAMFARLKARGGDLRTRVQRRTLGAQHHTLAGVGAAAGLAALNPEVTHLPLGRALGRYGPFWAAYAGIPAAAAVYARHRRGEATRGDLARAGAGAGLAGFGAWLGERAIVHSMPAILPKRLWLGEAAEALGHRFPRARLLAAHGAPLAVASVAAVSLGDRLINGKARTREEALRRLRRNALLGFGAFTGSVLAAQGSRFLSPRAAAIVRVGARLGTRAVIPGYMAHQILTARRRRKAKA